MLRLPTSRTSALILCHRIWKGYTRTKFIPTVVILIYKFLPNNGLQYGSSQITPHSSTFYHLLCFLGSRVYPRAVGARETGTAPTTGCEKRKDVHSFYLQAWELEAMSMMSLPGPESSINVSNATGKHKTDQRNYSVLIALGRLQRIPDVFINKSCHNFTY